MKKLVRVVAVMLAVFALCASVATAAELRDLDKEGNGFVVAATANGFTVTVVDRFVKLSVPFAGANADGWTQARGGESLIATAGWVNADGTKGTVKSLPYAVKADEGKVIYTFTNSSAVGKPINVAVSNGSVNDERLVWLCPPWTSQVFFARYDKAHPDGLHMIFFQLEGDVVRSVVSEAKSKGGWTPAAEYHAAKMK